MTPFDKRQNLRLRNEIAKFISRNTTRTEVRYSEPDPRGIAQFIARYKNQFKEDDYRRLNSAIAKGRITDPEILIALVSKNKPVWHQYLDHVVRTEKDYYKHLNYIHQNPVKHGLTKKMSQYKWSSIHQYIKQKGEEWLIDCFRQYPIIDFQPEGIAD